MEFKDYIKESADWESSDLYKEYDKIQKALFNFNRSWQKHKADIDKDSMKILKEKQALATRYLAELDKELRAALSTKNY